MLRRLVIGVVMNFNGMQCVQSNAYLNFRQKKGAQWAPNIHLLPKEQLSHSR